MTTGQRQVLIEEGSDARYLTSGHLVYAVDDNLLAVPFDPDRVEVTGGPIPVIEGVRRANVSVARHFDVSRDGMLVYLPPAQVHALRTLAWVDRDGRAEAIAARPRAYHRARISPDGTQAVLDLSDEQVDLWTWDVARETLTRLTFDPSDDRRGEWTPDGEHIVFASGRDGLVNLYRTAVDGSGSVERLSDSATRQFPEAFTPDGSQLVVLDVTGDNAWVRLSLLTLGSGDAARPLLEETGSSTFGAGLSPDGRWLAYHSAVSGRNEVYVRPFPDVRSGRWQVSTDSGRQPLWGPDGDELFYWASGRGMMRVPITTDPTFRPGNPELLFEAGAYVTGPRTRYFDISPDGERFLMVKETLADGAEDPYAGLTQFIVVHNWFTELERLVPTK